MMETNQTFDFGSEHALDESNEQNKIVSLEPMPDRENDDSKTQSAAGRSHARSSIDHRSVHAKREPRNSQGRFKSPSRSKK